MFAVHYFENKREILHRLQDNIPSEGDQIRIKGRNGRVLSLTPIDAKNIYVHILLEPKKAKFIPVDPRKKKRR